MVQTIRLIVFHSIKYRESDLLVYAYTPSHGRQTYVLKGYRTTQKRSASARIFPLNILEAEIYYHSGAPVHYIKSLYPVIDLSKIRGDVLKSSIALFLGELLYKSIKEEESHLPLYRFLVESIQTLNDLENG
ncbi:MAG: DNA repair protein RecO, partial [Bacteroidetes bacterium]|nr:DNA repair protein RecO [Bacteroidota bacterium]